MPPQNIIIIGAGILGTSTAYYLSLSPRLGGASITLLDSEGVATCASGKAGGFLARDWHAGPTASLGKMSFDLHASLAEGAEDGGKSWGYRRLDTLSVSIEEGSKAHKAKSPLPWLPQGSVEASRSLGTPATTAQATPALLTRELLTRFLTAPKTSYHVTSATSLQLSPSGTPESLLTTAKDGTTRSFPCDTLILCAGPWTGSLARTLLGEKIGRSISITGNRAHSIQLNMRGVELGPWALFTEVAMRDGGQGEPEVYARPDGTAYVCGASDNEPLPATPGEVTFSPASIAKLHAQTKALSPVFANTETLAEQACYLPMPDRGTPMIGKVRGVEGVWVNSGHSCWGITLGPGSGLVMAELVLEGKAKSADISKLAP